MVRKDSRATSRRSVLKYSTPIGVMALAGCVGGSDEEGEETEDRNEITITLTGGPQSVDPHDHADTETNIILSHSYERLLDRTPEGDLIGRLASEWEYIDEEEGTVEFTIRDATFHNGDSVTTEDVAYSINRIVQEEVGGIPSPQADELPGVTEAEAIDDNVVRVYSDGINPMIFSNFAVSGQIVQRDWMEEQMTDQDGIAETNGTGPYELQNYEEDVEIAFDSHSEYWGENAEIGTVTFTWSSESSTRVSQLLNEETDLITNVPSQYITDVQEGDVSRIESERSARTLFCLLRYDIEPFSSVEFRRAINYAIDLDSIIENVLSGFGEPTGQPTLEGHTGYNPEIEPYPYDFERAEELIDESGLEDIELTLETPVGRYYGGLEVAQAVAGYLNDLSEVSCSVSQREFGDLVGLANDGDITTTEPFWMVGWGNEVFDASQTVDPLFTTDGFLSNFSDEEVDNLVAEAQEEEDPERREELYQQINQRLHDQAACLFLHQQYGIYGINDQIEWDPREDEMIDAYEMNFE